MNRRVNDDVDDASFTRYSHLCSRVDGYTAGDLAGGHTVLYSTSHQKADRKSAILAAKGPDRRVGRIGPFWLSSRILVQSQLCAASDCVRLSEGRGAHLADKHNRIMHSTRSLSFQLRDMEEFYTAVNTAAEV